MTFTKFLRSLFLKFFSTRNERKLKACQVIIDKINELESSFASCSADEIKAKRNIFLERFKNGETLESLLPECFAVVREASKRVLKMRHFDVQLIGGIALHEGKIAEMKTGEGKTLVATLAAFLNSLQGKVHVVTANDYLAKRDALHLTPLYNALGAEVGLVTNETPQEKRKAEYAKDIIYTTNNELGFDYLRDNMALSIDKMALIPHKLSFAIVDEIDSILIDEARTPLIISGESEGELDYINEAAYIIRHLSPSSFEVDESQKNIYFTESGYTEVESMLRKMGVIGQDEFLFGEASYKDSILKPEIYFRNSKIIHFLNAALRAAKLFHADKDYMVSKDQILIIDEFTSRISEGRRFGNGLHQALEVKHGIKPRPEMHTVASITYQNYFRLYKKLAGMTGTAQEEAEEFREIYKLDVISIPTNKKVIRMDKNDIIYKSEREKFQAIIKIVEELHNKGQPILIGTASITKSETLSQLFTEKRLKHTVLNAKHHEKESEIIANAGCFGALTIATNMAGRGTDIMLGGNLEKKLEGITDANQIARITKEHLNEAEKVRAAGGLFILASERHESRRIDDQLRGRSGRQGDIGYSQFFLSLQDDLLRIFGGSSLENILSKLGFKEGEAIDHPLLNKVIKRAQRKVESHNFEIRKNLLKYDDLLNQQRHIIYSKRMEIVQPGNGFEKEMEEIISDELESIFLLIEASEKEEIFSVEDSLRKMFGLPETFKLEGESAVLKQKIEMEVNYKYRKKIEEEPEKHRFIILQCLDYAWKEHLQAVDSIKGKVSLRSYAQKDPLNEYKIELFKAFEEMMLNYRKLVIRNTFSS